MKNAYAFLNNLEYIYEYISLGDQFLYKHNANDNIWHHTSLELILLFYFWKGQIWKLLFHKVDLPKKIKFLIGEENKDSNSANIT